MLEVVDLGYPPPEANWPLLSPAGTEVYRLDLAWPDLRIAAEYNGYAAHIGQEAEDEARLEDLRRRGWLVISVTSDDLRDSRRLERELRSAFVRRGAGAPVC
jgi:very-short-patch-repair endonuclease